jgi:hypothetical protein
VDQSGDFLRSNVHFAFRHSPLLNSVQNDVPSMTAGKNVVVLLRQELLWLSPVRQEQRQYFFYT